MAVQQHLQDSSTLGDAGVSIRDNFSHGGGSRPTALRQQKVSIYEVVPSTLQGFIMST